MTPKRIVIELNSQNLSLANWVYFDETEAIGQTVIDSNLENITALAKESDTIVIVPAQDVLLTHVTLPKLNRQRLLQALPYALEEQLINDVDELHFAIGEYQPDGTLPVAIVSKHKMQQWIDALKAFSIEPAIMLPTTLAIPFKEDHTVIYRHKNIHLVRTGKYSGFAADDATLAVYLTTAQVEIQSGLDSNLHWDDKEFPSIAQKIANQPYINLLQKPYVAKRKSARTKNVWRLAGYLAAAWIMIVFFSNLISFFILHYQSSSINSKIRHIYFQQFPQAKEVIAPRERMESKLKQTALASQKNNFLGLLSSVGKSLSQTHGIRLQNMDYRNGLLTMEVSSAAFDNLDNLTQDLNAKGLTVKQQNSATTGSQVKATLIISAGAS